MKRFFNILILTFISMSLMAQTPEKFNYQAAVRGSDGELLANANITLRISVRAGSDTGAISYAETHSVTTNDFGLVNLRVGNGTPETGLFSDINWSDNNHYIQVELDTGEGFETMGTQQLVSVPYAKYSDEASMATDMTLEHLNDINVFDPQDGQIMQYDAQGNLWVAADLQLIQQLQDLTDVDMDHPQDGQVMQYDASGNLWIAADPQLIDQLQELTDVDMDDPQDGQIMQYDAQGNIWVAADPEMISNLEDLADVGADSPQAQQILYWDGSSWEAKDEEVGLTEVETGISLAGDGTQNSPLVLSQQGAGTGEVLKWNGSAWTPAEDQGSNWQLNGNNLFTEEYNIGIHTDDPKAPLHVYNQNVLFGSSPEGSNTRMIWLHDEGALRAGRVTNNNWDMDSVGSYSVAFGDGTKATGSTAVAWGRNTEATGLRATAWGFNTVASGSYATAFGYSNNASGSYTTAFGYENNATASYATTWGRENEATNTGATAAGLNNQATGIYSTVFGANSVASGNYSFALGRYVEANGFQSFTIGRGTTSSPLVNDNSSSLMVGFGSDPTFYVQNGRVGINTDSPIRDLHIHQTSASRGLAITHSDYPDSKDFVINNTASGSSSYLDFRYEGSLLSYINEDDGEYYVASDRRLKENIEPVKSVLQRVMDLEPVNYRYKGRNGNSTTGLIAQDVLELFPQLVNKRENDKDDSYAISYSGFSIIAIRAIQEQQQIIHDKKQDLENQKNTIEQQQKMLEQQEKAIQEISEKLDNLIQELE